MTKLTMSSISFTLLALTLSTFIPPSTAGDTLTPSQPLTDGQTLVSATGTFALGFFSPDNSKLRYVGIWYNNIPVHTVVWVANRQDPITDSTGTLSISTNGTLVITGQNSTVLWTSAAITTSTATNNLTAQLLDTGNFAVVDTDTGRFLWQSFDYPTDTLLPGMKLGWDKASGLNRNLTSWKSRSDPAPGAYTIYIDVSGDPQLILGSGQSWAWRGGPWVGVRFSGIPEMMTYNHAFNFTFVNTADEVYYSYSVLEGGMISRVIVDDLNNGSTHRYAWDDDSKIWTKLWYAPKDRCDDYSQCYAFGVCDANESPICQCLHGFKPKEPDNWALWDWSDGCVRETALDCFYRSDGFMTVSGAKLPDTSSATVDTSMSLGDCMNLCLGNCSCTAYAAADISEGGEGSGCIIWSAELTDLRLLTEVNVANGGGQDLYVRLAAADLELTHEPRPKAEAAVLIVLGTVIGALILSCICCRLWKKNKMERDLASFRRYEANGEKDLELPLFDMNIIVAATDRFCNQNKLGEGGFGPVYKGSLGDGWEIAVKRLANTSLQGDDQFMNEVKLIAKLQHRNLVRLLGCCIEEKERMLIYEYLPNKSLDVFLFDKAKAALLDWQLRYQIIIGIARGMLYLHHDSRVRIIHRDLKASNILLDKDMTPKISDFGMARISGADEIEVNTCKVVGTYGYMSPEYAMDGIFSIKSDVFSFGVLVLEIISGVKNRGVYHLESHLNLLGHAWSLWKEGKGLDLVDDSICHSIPMAQALKCIKIGLLCVQERPEDRPTMSMVYLMLGSDNEALPHPKEPGFVAARNPFQMDVTSTQESQTVNEVTVTVLNGR